MEMLMSQGVK